jgi:SnoaL-like domain
MWADEIALNWILAWNDHDLDRIMEHYAEDVLFQAPTVVRRWGRADGRLRGRGELREHFRLGLERAPGLRFELDVVLLGAEDQHVVVYRRDNGNRVADVVRLDAGGRAVDVRAFYASVQE